VARGYERPASEELSLAEAQTTPVTRLPLRPGYGTLGSPVTVLANHFILNFDKDATDFAIHYDVDIQNTVAQVGPSGGRRGGRAAVADPGGASPSAAATRAQRPLPSEIGRGVMAALAQRDGWPVGWCYDGKKNVYTPGKFAPFGNGEVCEFRVAHDEKGNGRPSTFLVLIKKVGVISFNALRAWVRSGQDNVPADAFVALDIVLRHRVSMIPDTVSFARAIFVPHGSTTSSLGEGADVWLGYQQASRPCQRGISIVINQAATAFVHSGPILERYQEAARLSQQDLHSEINPRDWRFREIKKAVNGVKVVVSHPNKRTYRVTGLSDVPARNDFFDHDELGRITVEAYFARQHGVKLRYPMLPCLRVGSNGSRIPPEICTVVAGLRVKKLSPRQTQEMIKIAACPPAQKQQSIQQQVSQNLRFGLDPQVGAFGLTVAPQMAEVKARVLEAPVLQYRQPPTMRVNGGKWNLVNCKFLEPGTIRCWAVMCFVPRAECGRSMDEGLGAFMTHFQHKLGAIGITWATQAAITPMMQFCARPGGARMNEEVAFEMTRVSQSSQAKHGRVPDLILCIMPSKDTELYRAIKIAGDHHHGIVTQCLVASSAGITRDPRGQDQYIANVAMKVNAKLGGTNVTIHQQRFPLLGTTPFQSKPFMVIGADVSHPTGAGARASAPSIAAVVGSLDMHCSKYAAKIMMQDSRVEIIAALDEAVAGLLLEFYKKTGGKKPERIIFYRDGVADGQFQHVLDQELPLLRKACRDVSGDDYQPDVTFVVVQKRHMTRLFPKTQQDGDFKGNLKPGTVIDTDICHPHEFDFFLNSHEGIQGTVRPAHYHVLLDENKFSADQLQLLTHHLCYLYCRCTRSVSIVQPAYYAHLAAERGRILCSAYGDSDSDAASTASGGTAPAATFEDVNPLLSGRMFFV